MPENSRQERRFDLEAQKRNRRNFVLMVAAFALLAMISGVTLALWILSPPDEQAPPPIAEREDKPIDPSGFEPFEDGQPKTEPKRTGGGVKRALDKGDVSRGLGKIQAALDKCAAKHGAIDGTKIGVDFSVGPNGRVTDSFARQPHTKNPLGICVAGVIRDKGKFRKTKEGLGDIRRQITLRRTSL